MEILLSVIIPVYNTEQYLPRCINSIMSQNVESIEIILINDGSTDKSGEICDEFKAKHENIIVIHQKNCGVSVARNRGLDVASGKFIGFVDSDDYIEPNMYRNLIGVCITRRAEISSCMRKTLRENDEFFYEKTNFISKTITNNQAIKELLLGNIQPSVCQMVFSKSAVRDLRFYEGKNINEDKYFLFTCFLNVMNVSFINDFFYIVFYRSNSASRREFDMRIFDIIFYSERIVEDIKNNKYLELLPFAYYNDLVSKLSVFRKMCRSSAFILKNRKIFENLRKKIIEIDVKKGKSIPYKYRFELFLISYFPVLYRNIVLMYYKIVKK